MKDNRDYIKVWDGGVNILKSSRISACIDVISLVVRSILLSHVV